jgi:hypothetical protein
MGGKSMFQYLKPVPEIIRNTSLNQNEEKDLYTADFMTTGKLNPEAENIVENL